MFESQFYLPPDWCGRFSINDGVELTKWLYYDTHWVASLFSYFRQEPSVEFLQACEETTVYSPVV